MAIQKDLFGQTHDGQDIFRYTLTNGTITAKVISFGAVLSELHVPDRKGQTADVVLGFESCENYLTNKDYFGAVVGPCANRIGGAKFTLDGNEYILPANDGPNNLHTDGELGLHRKLWTPSEGPDSVTFSILVPDGEAGFPGNRTLSVTYSINDKNGLVIRYHATSDKPTVMNPTNHSYFNLAGHNAGGAMDQEVRLCSRAFTAVRPGAIPTGEIRPVAGTPMDFTDFHTIGERIESDYDQLVLTRGYDHNYVIDGYDGKTLNLAAVARDPVSGRTMETYTTLPGVQFYAGNYVDDEGGKDGAYYGIRSAYCFEAQYYPDAIHHESFPQPVFGPGKDPDSVTEYRFV